MIIQIETKGTYVKAVVSICFIAGYP